MISLFKAGTSCIVVERMDDGKLTIGYIEPDEVKEFVIDPSMFEDGEPIGLVELVSVLTELGVEAGIDLAGQGDFI